MAEETVGKKMSEYASVDTLTGEEKATYLGNAVVTSIGSKTVGGSLENYNVPLSEIGGSSLPDASSASVGDVLTLNNSKEPIWQVPQGGGGGSSFTVETLSGPYSTGQYGQVIVELPSNHKIYELTNLPNDGENIEIVPPTVASGEVIDVYVNIELPDTDDSSHYIYAIDMQRISDGDCNDSYSTADKYTYAFMHIFYKYYTISHYSDE